MMTISKAFGSHLGLYQKILVAIDETPQYRALFEEVASYHLHALQSRTPPSKEIVTSDLIDEPAAKKRKLLNGSLPIHPISGDRKIILEAPEISFTIPQRKKLTCGIYVYPQTGTYTIAGKTSAAGPEFEVPVNTIGTALSLSVPEKAQKQWNYVLLPKSGREGENMGVEGVVFTLSEPSVLDHRGDKDKSMLEAALDHAGVNITFPSEVEFASATPEAHRKNEKAYHVKAFRGSKDGFLFFLSTGIFFGFKKPLFFVGLEDIQSVSYTSVLQRTFNMVITYKSEGEEEDQEIEFSMLDQADFNGINGRAKMLGKKKAEANGVKDEDGEEEDGRTELEKAEAQLQDEEDEGEEDFELGSDEEDEDGSEASDEDEDYDGESGDLVAEELGNEAEDVSGEEEEDGEEEEEQEEEEMVEEVPRPVPVRAPVAPSRRAGVPDPEDDDQL